MTKFLLKKYIITFLLLFNMKHWRKVYCVCLLIFLLIIYNWSKFCGSNQNYEISI